LDKKIVCCARKYWLSRHGRRNEAAEITEFGSWAHGKVQTGGSEWRREKGGH
jgi:hypothetical protein